MSSSNDSSTLDSSYEFDNASHCTPPDRFIDDYVEFLSILFTYGFTFVVGLIGNALIIYTVLHFRRMRTLPNMFLANLAFADILLIIVCVPIKFAQLFSFTWQFGWLLCKLVHYIQNISAVCSVYTLTAISVERYYGIIHPVRSRATCSMEKTRWLIIGIWVMAIVLAFPVVIIRIMFPINCNAFYCIPDYDSFWIVPYELYMLFIILLFPTVILVYTYSRICHRLWVVLRCRGHLNAFSADSVGRSSRRSSLLGESSVQTTRLDMPQLAPTCVATASTTNNTIATVVNGSANVEEPSSLITCSTELIENSAIPLTRTNCSQITTNDQSSQVNCRPDGTGVLRNCGRIPVPPTRRNSSQLKRVYQERSDDQTVKQVIKMLAAVVILFIFCWTPILVFNLLRGFGVISRYNKGILKPINTVSHLLSYLNSALNPLIYGFMSRHFRRSFQAVFTLCFGQSKNRARRQYPVTHPLGSQQHNVASSKPATFHMTHSSNTQLGSRHSAGNLMQLTNLSGNTLAPQSTKALQSQSVNTSTSNNNNQGDVPNHNAKVKIELDPPLQSSVSAVE